MRSFALAIAGLAAVSQALPTGESSGLTERQTFQIGEPGLLAPNEPVPAVPVPTPETTITISTRDLFWFPDDSSSDADNIAEAELKLEDAQQALDDCDDEREKRQLKNLIQRLQRYLREKAGIIKITTPPGTTSTFTPGKRDAASIKLVSTYTKLAGQYKSKHPSLSVYLILMQLKGILEREDALPKNIIFLGPATSTISISSKRQIFGIGGSCAADEIASLLFTYSSLQTIYGPHPSPQIQSLETAIATALRYCNTDPITGTINPNPSTSGSPLTPNPTVTGGSMVPNPSQTGGSLVPNSSQTGGSLVPNPSQTGAPLKPST